MASTAQEKRRARIAATLAARQEQEKQKQLSLVEPGLPDVGRPSWVNEATAKIEEGDGAWVKLGEHLTRQSAEHGRARLRRKLRAEGVADEYELWVTVDRAQISKELLRKADKAMKIVIEQDLPRPKMRRPAAVFGRWTKGTLEPEVVQQRVAGQAGGAATREANQIRAKQTAKTG